MASPRPSRVCLRSTGRAAGAGAACTRPAKGACASATSGERAWNSLGCSAEILGRTGLAGRADRLAEGLGEERDLALLQARVAGMDGAGKRDRRVLVKLIERRRERLAGAPAQKDGACTPVGRRRLSGAPLSATRRAVQRADCSGVQPTLTTVSVRLPLGSGTETSSPTHGRAAPAQRAIRPTDGPRPARHRGN